MMATLEQTQSELSRLVSLVQQGEEVIITSQGRAIAKLSAVQQGGPAADRQAWMARLRHLRENTATGKTVPMTDEILEDLRSERAETTEIK